jgi:hypothetical protein
MDIGLTQLPSFNARSCLHRVSNCDLIAARSLIDWAASRVAVRAPALRTATALTRPNRSAQRLPCGRHAVPTAQTVSPSNIVTNHCVERGDHLAHHRHNHDLRLLSARPPLAAAEAATASHGGPRRVAPMLSEVGKPCLRDGRVAGYVPADHRNFPGSFVLTTVSEKPGARDMNEVSLAIKTPKGLAVVVGCSHPGVEKSSRTPPQSIRDSTPSPAAFISW